MSDGEPTAAVSAGSSKLSPLSPILDRLAAWGSSRDWVGADPFEGLNTPAGALLRHLKPARQAVIQAYKRLPVAPPWPLRAASRPNAKVAGLVLSAYAQPAGAALPEARHWVGDLAGRLELLRLADSHAWGYHFDVQTRHLFYPQRAANAIATCFCVRGLLDAHDSGLLPDGAELALRAKPFLASLRKEHPEHGPFFAYVEAGSELIHNANLSVCGTLARLLAHEPDPELGQRVLEAVETTARLRRPDGNWPYGERADLGWRDSFHTAYVLEGLARVHQWSGEHAELLDDATRCWREAFFDSDGTASYRPDRRYPIDTHSAASAIDALCVVAEARPLSGAEVLDNAARAAERAVDLLWLADEGRFANQVNARFTNRREFMRWTNAPMFEALARLLSRLPWGG